MNSAAIKQKEGFEGGEVPASTGLNSETGSGVVNGVSTAVNAAVSAQSKTAHESAEQWPSSFELKNEKGEVVGIVTVEYADDLPQYGTDHFKRLTGLTITNPETGLSVALQDLVSRNISEIFIQVPGKKTKTDNQYIKNNVLLNTPLDTVETFLVLLHELSHGEQDLEDSLKKIHALYTDLRTYYPQNSDYLRDVISSIPSAREAIEADGAFTDFSSKLRAMDTEIADIKSRSVTLEREKHSLQQQNPLRSLYKGLKRFVGTDDSLSPRHRIKNIDTEMSLLKYRFSEAITQRKKFRDTHPINPHDLFSLPFYYYEWDANNRAFEKVAMIQDKTGVDLGSKVKYLEQAVLHWVGRDIPYPQTLKDVINIYRTPARTSEKGSAESYATPALCGESLQPAPASEVQ